MKRILKEFPNASVSESGNGVLITIKESGGVLRLRASLNPFKVDYYEYNFKQGYAQVNGDMIFYKSHVTGEFIHVYTKKVSDDLILRSEDDTIKAIKDILNFGPEFFKTLALYYGKEIR